MTAFPLPRWGWLLAGMASAMLAGCEMGPAAVTAPPLDSASAAAGAMKAYDANSDGKLDAAELAKAPALQKHLADYDADKDGNLTAAEITTRIAAWNKSNIGLITVQAWVTLDGKPLEGAKVELIPEDFMGGAILPASGTTNSAGGAPLGICLLYTSDAADE